MLKRAFVFLSVLASPLLLTVNSNSLASENVDISDLPEIEQTIVKEVKELVKNNNNHEKEFYKVSFSYELEHGNIISKKLETFFKVYRKPPSSSKIKMIKNVCKCDPDKIVEVIFNPNNKNVLSLLNKDPKKNNRKNSRVKYIKI